MKFVRSSIDYHDIEHGSTEYNLPGYAQRLDLEHNIFFDVNIYYKMDYSWRVFRSLENTNLINK